jgi:predicted phosphoribosyltransferase
MLSLGGWNDALFQDRRSAGRTLAALLSEYADRKDVVVLGLVRGGVPVALEVARALHAPLDVLVVRKLGVPGHCELAMGAIASGGVRVLNKDVLNELDIPPEVIDAVTHREQHELERREKLYRGDHPAQELRDRIAILTDDGLATGSTMRAAVNAVRRQYPARVIVAVPVAARETCAAFQEEVDECICALTPEYFHAVGAWYQDFSTVSDQDVRQLLELMTNEVVSQSNLQ